MNPNVTANNRKQNKQRKKKIQAVSIGQIKKKNLTSTKNIL